jgi:hypothetical protein
MSTISLDGLPSFIGGLFKEYRERQKKGLLEAALKGTSWIKSELIPGIKPFQPSDRGSFKAGWNFKPTDNGAEIFNPVPHAPFINFGVRASNVKVIGPHLEEWVRRKGIADGNDIPRVAWAIAMVLRRKGIFQNEQFRITERASKYLVDVVSSEVAKAIERG